MPKPASDFLYQLDARRPESVFLFLLLEALAALTEVVHAVD